MPAKTRPLWTLSMRALAPAVAGVRFHLGHVVAARADTDAGHVRLEDVVLDELDRRHAPLMGKLVELRGFAIRFGNGLLHALSFMSGCSCGKRIVVAYRLPSVMTHRVRPWRV